MWGSLLIRSNVTVTRKRKRRICRVYKSTHLIGHIKYTTELFADTDIYKLKNFIELSILDGYQRSNQTPDFLIHLRWEWVERINTALEITEIHFQATYWLHPMDRRTDGLLWISWNSKNQTRHSRVARCLWRKPLWSCQFILLADSSGIWHSRTFCKDMGAKKQCWPLGSHKS